MITIILDVYCGPGRPRTYQVNLPDDAPDTLIQSAVRDAVNRFIGERKEKTDG